MDNNTVLEMKNIHKSFPGVRALRGVDFHLNKGEIHALMGENGAGKSTLIKVLTGVYSKDEGQIFIDGNDKAVSIHSPQEAQKLGISTVYQEITLCPNLSVAENMYIGRSNKIYQNWKKMNEDADKILQNLDIPAKASQQLASCSIARRLCQSGEELRFYACGGDGTVNEVANGIIGYDNASMTVIPVGTGNDFLKNFGPEDMEKFRDAENLWDAPQFPIDAIDVNGRIALTIACSGIDARVAKDVHNFSESPILDGKSSYIVSLMVNFLFKGIGSHWTVELDGEAVEDDYALVAVCNGRYYGGGFMPVAEARMDDGVLNTLVVKKVSRLTFMKFVNPYSKGQYYKFPHLARCSTPKVIRIRSEKPDIITCLDGECITSDDVTIQLSDKRLNFFGPVGCSCNRTARKPLI